MDLRVSAWPAMKGQLMSTWRRIFCQGWWPWGDFFYHKYFMLYSTKNINPIQNIINNCSCLPPAVNGKASSSSIQEMKKKLKIFKRSHVERNWCSLGSHFQGREACNSSTLHAIRSQSTSLPGTIRVMLR